MILSSHLLEMIEELASRILILDRGSKVFDGTLQHARETVTGAEGGSLEEIFLKITERNPSTAPPVSIASQSPDPKDADWSSRGGGGAGAP